MSGPDRRHAVDVARGTVRLLSPSEPPREVVAAALLHDVGKVESALGTFARVGVTLGALAFGRTRLVTWGGKARRRRRPSLRARTAVYLTHDCVGAELLEKAGSDSLTVSWACDHHLGPARWSVDHRFGAALKQADGD
jgi:hypothetical protein